MATFKQYDTKQGKKWLFKVYLGIDAATGKRIETTRRNFPTKKAAQLELSRLQVEFEKNGLQQDTKQTFKEVYDLWLETYQTTVKEVTFIKTKIKFDKWILPKYGKMKIKDIDVATAQKIVNHWAKTTDQYRVLHSSASRVLKYAINLGMIDRNPLEYVLMPKRIKEAPRTEKIKVYTKQELKELFHYLDNTKPSYNNDFNNVLLRFLIYSGCRISEALALNWSDIDFNNQTVTINKTLSQTKNGYKVSTTKTAASNATLILDATTINKLKKWQIDQRKYMLTLGITEPTSIFCGIYKQTITHHAIYARLITIAKEANVPFLGVHSTRHTHASLLLDSGATMKEVQERLRHTKISQTLDVYGHLAKETKEKTVEKLVKHLDL
ncbi:tyrosine-type recombinase/integrase [Enterococcus casseliflavus]|uniref:tyrosine-type recombinase/integrase n=1 Tax=Enterococcus casseliflavus TaxID=37734 RepID=UPI0039FD91BB